MSRSRRRTPIVGATTSRSEKLDKRLANHALRALVRSRKTWEATIRLVSNVYCFSKDGKQYVGGAKRFRKLMRR